MSEDQDAPGAPALSVKGLRVHYGSRLAVDDLCLQVQPGQIVALLGPNGAGKSTALATIAGALTPTSGRVEVSRVDLEANPLVARRHIGFADQPPTLYEFFTVTEQVAFVGDLRSDTDLAPGIISDLLQRLDLQEIAGRLCRELSFGMRQRVSLACAIIGTPALVLLDETLNGLDPRAARAARDTIVGLAREGTAVLMSTHLLGVAEHIADRLLIMDHGKLVADHAGTELEALFDRGPGALEDLYLSVVTSSGSS